VQATELFVEVRRILQEMLDDKRAYLQSADRVSCRKDGPNSCMQANKLVSFKWFLVQRHAEEWDKGEYTPR
jgi:hypothetical protein